MDARVFELGDPISGSGIPADAFVSQVVSSTQITINAAATATASGVSLQGDKTRRNTDLAFWGNTLVQGDTRGLRIFNISNPASPALLSDYSCNGAYGDVSIWGNLVFRSIDVPQTTDQCAGSVDQLKTVAGGNHTNVAQQTTIQPGFEGIRIIDISDPTNPSFVAGVATDCGSFTHTLVPDLANNRVLLYVSSFPNAAIDANPTAYGNTCEQVAAGSPSPPDQISGHDKISIISVPLNNPAGAMVINEVTLGLKGYNSYFSYIGGYTGDYNNTPGYKGCHDIAVFMPTHTAAAACVTEGVTLDITNPAAPTVKDHFVNANADLCATGVFRWVSLTQATTPNCMWSSATFTWDGSRIIWGNLASGHGGCNSNSTTVAHSCNQGGNTNASVDRFYDGQSLSNECETGAGTAPVRSPINRSAQWMFDADDPSWPLASWKVPWSSDSTVSRYERYSNQGCGASLGNVVPVNGSYVLPLAWHAAGIDAVDWTNYLNPTELAWFEVNTSASETGTANPSNRLAGNSAEKSNTWAAYWYNGYVYASNEAPKYGSWNPDGSRGLEVFQLNDPSVAGAFDLPHLNPQTQETLLNCSVSIAGKLRAGKRGTARITVKVLGQGVLGAKVTAKTKGINRHGTTNANGKINFTFKPKSRRKLTVTVASQPNMGGCKATKSIARKRR